MRKRSKQENPHDRKNSQFVNSRPIKQGSAKTRSTQVFSSTMFQPSGNRSSQESPFCERLMCAIMSCNLCTPETEGNRNKKTPDSRIQIDVVAIAVAERCSLGCSPAGLVRNSKAAPGHAPRIRWSDERRNFRRWWSIPQHAPHFVQMLVSQSKAV
jgi:hypothetical protein